MKTFLLPTALIVLSMTIAPARAFVSNTEPTSSAPLTNPAFSSQQLISVGPDWARKLPGVKDALSREIAEFLKNNYARGNRRDAEVEALAARGTRLYLRAKVRHHHVWRRPWGGSTTVYSVTNTIEATFDPLKPDQTLDGSRLCFNLAPQVGGGKVCVSGRDLVRIIIGKL
ncbi:hypothetical protein NC981_23390 [Leptolyngbya sp. DQ-M1]|uniref:hypothetical protein n=1 Tax=Leptolyngbya sp. DQ-M1 TaxID=2933920 RepID=UPI0032995101